LMISAPLGLLLILYALVAINDPTSLLRGIFLKAMIIGSLIYGIRSAVLVQKYKKESSYLNRR
jgi:hypothetical protein